MVTVGEIMETEVFSIGENDKIKDLLQLFVEKQISGAPVVGLNKKLVGIITDADILSQIREYPSFLDFMTFVVVVDTEALTDAKILQMLDRPVKELMVKSVTTVEKSTGLAAAAKLLSKKKYKKLPVVEDGKLTGIITRGDMVGYLVREFLKRA
jgi:CBS domain-containing protein